jgi:tRNA-Thr(GGU) m(6)t(6)A37 methyltransferase TsaA
MSESSLFLRPIGIVHSSLKGREDCPLQGREGAPEATLSIDQYFLPALDGLTVGDDVLILTWLHLANRDVLTCYQRNEVNSPQQGVFSTRSPDRPNPIGLHRVTISSLNNGNLVVYPLEAVDGTLIIDIKPILHIREE